MNATTCLVTGGAGFIGCALSASLASRFDSVVVLDNLHPQVHKDSLRPAGLDPRVRLVVGDVTSADDLNALFRDFKPGTVIHLAAETGTGQSLTEASRHANVNVLGLTQLLDALARLDSIPESIFLTSSRAVYGEGAWRRTRDGATVYPGQRDRAMLESSSWDFPGLEALPFAADETDPKPTSVYGATKLAQEHVLRSWSLAYGVRPIILRLQNVYGPGQSLTNPYTGIVSLFCQMARDGKIIPVYEDGNIIRDFVFIDDVASAIMAALDRDSVDRDPYDVGSGVGTSVLQLANHIAKRYSAPPPVISGAYRHGDVRHASCDIVRTKRDLNWSPNIMLPDGLRRLCDWIEDSL